MLERRAILIQGIVQGVGFRPFVYHLARRLGLAGHVKNQTGHVFIEVEGAPALLDQFIAQLRTEAPPLAEIESLSWEPRVPQGEQNFRIQASDVERAGAVFVSPDVSTCADCLRELFDPRDRRFLYPFLNCTNCGPRLTIIQGAPYDRKRTTMAGFRMCAACQAEYDNPADRRFHAQPTACAACGPSLELRDQVGARVNCTDPLTEFVHRLHAGAIGAVKGLGGYHLICDARDVGVVAELRRRKHRDEKPFAIMVGDVSAAEQFCEVNVAERELLLSSRRPIVLLRKRLPSVTPGPAGAVAENVAPANQFLGVMLPYTPLHHLLLRAAGMPLVMTSGNRADEPIAYRDDEVLQKLGGIADLFLLHNRPIHVRCDDSVTRVVDGLELPVRRSRGYAPKPIKLPSTCLSPILALGGQLKATFALGRAEHAFISHHMGDLDYHEAYEAFVRDIELYQALFGIQPACLVHDLHPDYRTTHYAAERAAWQGIRVLAVQHHHAHLASCMAEHGLSGPVIGVTFDGAGLGTDGAIWGGEFLTGDYRDFDRVAHFRYVGMPGGEKAIREPWRMALAHLADAGIELPSLKARLLPTEAATVEQMLARRFNTSPTSSAGRLFDAVASLADVRDRVSYEGQAAVELEWLASRATSPGPYPFLIETSPGATAPLIIDTRPLIRAVVEDVQRTVSPEIIARRFHATVVAIIADICGRLRASSGLDRVVLSGGVFLNALLTSEVTARLAKDRFHVYRHCRVPPNDGGLSLGQLAIAAAALAQGSANR